MKLKVLMLGAVFAFVNAAQAQEHKEEWKALVGASGIFNTGNSVNQTLGGNAVISVKQDKNQISWSGNGAYGRAKDPATGVRVTNTENWLTQIKYDRFLTEKFSVYTLGHMYHNAPAGFDLTYGGSEGISQLWYESKFTTFKYELGFDFTRQRFVTNVENNIYSARLFLQFTHKFNEITSLNQDIENLFNVTDKQDYRLNTLTSLGINMTKKVAFQVGYAIRLDNQPVPGFKKVDTTTQLGLNINIL